MKIYSLIELLLLTAAFYAVLTVDATATKLWISLPCLVVVLISERIRKKETEEKVNAEKLKNFSSENLRRRMHAENNERHYRS